MKKYFWNDNPFWNTDHLTEWELRFGCFGDGDGDSGGGGGGGESETGGGGETDNSSSGGGDTSTPDTSGQGMDDVDMGGSSDSFTDEHDVSMEDFGGDWGDGSSGGESDSQSFFGDEGSGGGEQAAPPDAQSQYSFYSDVVPTPESAFSGQFDRGQTEDFLDTNKVEEDLAPAPLDDGDDDSEFHFSTLDFDKLDTFNTIGEVDADAKAPTNPQLIDTTKIQERQRERAHPSEIVISHINQKSFDEKQKEISDKYEEKSSWWSSNDAVKAALNLGNLPLAGMHPSEITGVDKAGQQNLAYEATEDALAAMKDGGWLDNFSLTGSGLDKSTVALDSLNIDPDTGAVSVGLTGTEHGGFLSSFFGEIAQALVALAFPPAAIALALGKTIMNPPKTIGEVIGAVSGLVSPLLPAKVSVALGAAGKVNQAAEIGSKVMAAVSDKFNDPNSALHNEVLYDIVEHMKAPFNITRDAFDTKIGITQPDNITPSGTVMVADASTTTGSGLPHDDPSGGWGDENEPEAWSDRIAEVTPKPEDAISEETTLNSEDIFGTNVGDLASTELLTDTTFGGRQAGLSMPYGSTSAFGAVVDELQDVGEGATNLMGQKQSGKLTQARV